MDNKSFKTELTELLNKHSKEKDSNTPDHILADYLISCLEIYNFTTQRAALWHHAPPIYPTDKPLNYAERMADLEDKEG